MFVKRILFQHSMVLNKLLELGMIDLTIFLIENGFSRGKIDTTLFRKTHNSDLLIV